MPSAPASEHAFSPQTSEMSIPTWKRVPTTFEVLFSLQLPYRAPESAIGAFLWRKRLWFEATFAFTMLQPWEKLILVCFMNILSALFITGLCLYLPTHLSFIVSRSKYYLLGQDDPSVSFAESVQQLLSNWRWSNGSAVWKSWEL